MVVSDEEVYLSPVTIWYITIQLVSLPHSVVVDATRNVKTLAELQYHFGGASILPPPLLERVFVCRVVQFSEDEIQLMLITRL